MIKYCFGILIINSTQYVDSLTVNKFINNHTAIQGNIKKGKVNRTRQNQT